MKLDSLRYFSLIIFVSVFALNCSGSKTGPDLSPEPARKMMSNIPSWFMDTPKKEGYRYETATATSQDLQLAINKATLDAASRLAATIESEMEGYTKRVQEESGANTSSDLLDRYSQTQSQIIATSLQDYSVVEKELLEERSNNQNIFRAYVLLEWDEGAAQKKLLDKIKSDKEIYDAIRATELMEEMEDKVEAYRNRKSGN